MTLDEQILEVREELVDRRRLYAWRVKHRRMKQSEADRKIAAMFAVLTTLEQLKDASGQ